jgi:hypothetical protein
MIAFVVSARNRSGAAEPVFATCHIFLLPHFPQSGSVAGLSDVQHLQHRISFYSRSETRSASLALQCM